MGERKRATIVEVDEAGLTWRKSSVSAGGGGSCVEFAQSSAAVFIRNSRDRHGARIAVDDSAWRLLVQVAHRL